MRLHQCLGIYTISALLASGTNAYPPYNATSNQNVTVAFGSTPSALANANALEASTRLIPNGLYVDVDFKSQPIRRNDLYMAILFGMADLSSYKPLSAQEKAPPKLEASYPSTMDCTAAYS